MRSRPGRTYLAGVALVALASLALGAALPEATGQGLRRALAIALVVQVPLGWWLVRTLGTPAFMAAWVLGMLARVLAIAVVALVVAPALGWPLEPVLVALVALLFALLGLECVMVVLVAPRASGAGASKDTQAEER